MKKPEGWDNEYDKYRAYLDSDIWTILRNKRLEMDNFKCSICGNPNNLEVHHLKYPSVLGTEPLSDLMTLCNSCHKRIDDIRKDAKYNRRSKKWENHSTVWIRSSDEETARTIKNRLLDFQEAEDPKNCIFRARVFAEKQNTIANAGYISMSDIAILAKELGTENVIIK